MIPKYSLKDIMSSNFQTLKYPKEKDLTKEFEFIYKPNDDSYMMLYTILKDIEMVIKEREVLNICELGIGSGYIINNLASYLKQNNEHFNYYGIDININSCFFARDFSKFNKNSIEIINTRNFEFLNGLAKQIDILILNPVC